MGNFTVLSPILTLNQPSPANVNYLDNFLMTPVPIVQTSTISMAAPSPDQLLAQNITYLDTAQQQQPNDPFLHQNFAYLDTMPQQHSTNISWYKN